MDIREPEITEEDILILPDNQFHTGNVCIVTGAASGIGRAMAVAASANNLMTVGLDLDGDGAADLVTVIHIPKDEGADTGSVSGVKNDPLSSLILPKLRRIAAAHGIRLSRIGISPSALSSIQR